MALLASYMQNRTEGETLDDYLNQKVFAGQESSEILPDPKDVEGFDAFIKAYVEALPVERAAVEHF